MDGKILEYKASINHYELQIEHFQNLLRAY